MENAECSKVIKFRSWTLRNLLRILEYTCFFRSSLTITQEKEGLGAREILDKVIVTFKADNDVFAFRIQFQNQSIGTRNP